MTTAKISITSTIRAEVQKRFDNHTATKYDEVMLALFNENMEQREKILSLSLKLSMCEMSSDPMKLSEELVSIMYGSSKEQPIAQD